jgi:hypothetical protein
MSGAGVYVSMRRILTGLAGRRLAQAVALLYLIGCMLPTVAVAFADSSAYCFEDIAEIGVSAVHVHSDGTLHRHADKKSEGAPRTVAQHEDRDTPTGTHGHSHDANCCGLFSFSAVLPILAGTNEASPAYQIPAVTLCDYLVGCDPIQIDRPPITSPSM